MIRTIAWSSFVALGLVAASPATQPETTRPVTWNDIGDKVQIIGPCGKPMGTLVTIEGELVDPATAQSKFEAGAVIFKADLIDGEKQPTPIRLLIDEASEGGLQLGRRYQLVGWDGGGFTGLPSEATEFMNAHEITIPATIGWSFLPVFLIIKATDTPRSND